MTEVDKTLRLQRERHDKLGRIRELLDRAQLEKRDLSRREKADYEALVRDAERLGEQLQLDGRRFQPQHGADADTPAQVLRSGQLMTDWVREHRSGTFDHGMLDELTDPSRFSIARSVRGMVTGNWSGAELERRALSEGAGSGGYLTPEPLGAILIDRLRNAMAVGKAGMRVVPMTSDVLNLARLDTGVTPSWKSEGAAISASDATFSRVTFTARTLPILTLISRELLEDMEDGAAQLLENELVQAIALELDRACLRGSGTPPEPQGVRNQSGVPITALATNGLSPTWDNIIDGVSTCRAANVEPSAILWSSRTSATLGKLKESTGAYVVPPAVIDGIQRLTTNQIGNTYTVGSSNDCSEVFVGAFEMLLLGLRNNVGFALVGSSGGNGFGTAIRVLEERYADTLQVGLITYIRGDVQLAHSAAFTVLTGVRP